MSEKKREKGNLRMETAKKCIENAHTRMSVENKIDKFSLFLRNAIAL